MVVIPGPRQERCKQREVWESNHANTGQCVALLLARDREERRNDEDDWGLTLVPHAQVSSKGHFGMRYHDDGFGVVDWGNPWRIEIGNRAPVCSLGMRR